MNDRLNTRAAINAAFVGWSEDELKLLEYLVGLGSPTTILAACQDGKAEGVGLPSHGPETMPATSAGRWARAEVLGAWRAVALALGVKILGPPGTAHASLARAALPTLPGDGK